MSIVMSGRRFTKSGPQPFMLPSYLRRGQWRSLDPKEVDTLIAAL
jgi:hypothetical protein